MWSHVKFFPLFVTCLCYLSYVSASRCDPKKCLILLNCRCAGNSTEAPGGLVNPADIPQFVNLVFQGPLPDYIHNKFLEIFKNRRKNADGCRQTATFFIPGKASNNWDGVTSWYKRGFEIGAYSNSYTTMQDYWRKITRTTISDEASGAKTVISKESGIPSDEIRGWRSPLLEFGGDAMMSGLQQSDFKYDSTLKLSPHDRVWPFTMDYGWPFTPCNRYTNGCITGSYRGFWEAPVITHNNNGVGELATFDRLPSEHRETMFNAWRDSFLSYYRDRNKRVPFMMSFTTSFFVGDSADVRVGAMKDFLSWLQTQPDVYVTTIWEMLAWVKRPTPSFEMRSRADCQKPKKGEKEDEYKPTYDHRQFSRWHRFLYYYGARAGARTSTVDYTMVSLMFATAILRNYL